MRCDGCPRDAATGRVSGTSQSAPGGLVVWEAPHTRPKAIVRNCQVGHRQHPHPTGSGVGGGGGTLAGPDRAVHADMGVARDRVHVVHVAMSWDPYRVGRCFHEVNVSIEFYLLFETFVFPTVDLKTIFFSLRTVSTECTLGSVQGLHNTAATVSDPFLFLPATPRNLPLSLEPLRMSHVPPNPITFDPPFLGQQIAVAGIARCAHAPVVTTTMRVGSVTVRSTRSAGAASR